ncbi:hypothetical protein ODQ37_20670, partial [Escherichia coli]|nr:hypothetical protein [Escherichia coli]
TGGTADRNRSHWSTSKTPSYTKSVSWQHHPFSVTLVAVILSLGGKFIHFMEPLSRVSWFVGVIVAFAAYALLKKRTTAEKTGEQKTIG